MQPQERAADGAVTPPGTGGRSKDKRPSDTAIFARGMAVDTVAGFNHSYRPSVRRIGFSGVLSFWTAGEPPDKGLALNASGCRHLAARFHGIAGYPLIGVRKSPERNSPAALLSRSDVRSILAEYRNERMAGFGEREGWARRPELGQIRPE